MQEAKQDLFETIFDPITDAICITTNGNFTKGGLAVMGGGSAGVAAGKWPELPKNLGQRLKMFGSNIPYIIGACDYKGNYLKPDNEMIKKKQYKCLIFSFPTINNLADEGANLQLIKQSATIMMDYATSYGLKKIVIGRPGVGIGGLLWADVKPELEKILDDRFLIVSFEHEE